jgi:hypothetical protein
MEEGAAGGRGGKKEEECDEGGGGKEGERAVRPRGLRVRSSRGEGRDERAKLDAVIVPLFGKAILLMWTLWSSLNGKFCLMP